MSFDFGGGPVDVYGGKVPLKQIRWKHLSYIMQGSMSVLNPVRRVRTAFYDFAFRHMGLDRPAFWTAVRTHLSRLGLDPAVLDAYPHQLSGGMRQRVTIALATVYVYGAREFTETLLAQPVRRRALFSGLYLGLSLPFAGAFAAGVGLPLAMRGFGDADTRAAALTLLVTGTLLTLCFTAIACCVAFIVEDRLRGLSTALAVWLVLGVLYDGVVLTIVAAFSDRPLEPALLALTFANPIDLARVLLLLRLDVAALMGYTGAAFERFFAGAAGTAVAFGALAFWIATPALAAARRFSRKDF